MRPLPTYTVPRGKTPTRFLEYKTACRAPIRTCTELYGSATSVRVKVSSQSELMGPSSANPWWSKRSPQPRPRMRMIQQRPQRTPEAVGPSSSGSPPGSGVASAVEDPKIEGAWFHSGSNVQASAMHVRAPSGRGAASRRCATWTKPGQDGIGRGLNGPTPSGCSRQELQHTTPPGRHVTPGRK